MNPIPYHGDFYLICSPRKRGYAELAARITNRVPALDANEVAVKLSVTLPRALFTRPALQASITVPDSSVPGPVINGQVLDNIREAMRQTLGFDITLSVVEPTKPEEA